MPKKKIVAHKPRARSAVVAIRPDIAADIRRRFPKDNFAQAVNDILWKQLGEMAVADYDRNHAQERGVFISNLNARRRL